VPGNHSTISGGTRSMYPVEWKALAQRAKYR